MDNRPFGESVRKPPLDGTGPKGGGECYYTSRVLNSTAHYANFVKKLRALEEDQRIGNENALKILQDTQLNDFFNRCDRNLSEMLQKEEEYNVYKFVEMAQSGEPAIWQDKKDRLAFLIAKRKKEHADKYKETPLSKCVHVHPYIVGLRSKEAEKIQLYQMREKEAQKEAQREFDKMWYAVSMKEAAALAARMEYDTILTRRRTMDAKKESDQVLQQRRLDEQKERERLKLETQYFRNLWAADIKKEEDVQRKALEKRMETARDRKQSVVEREEMLARAAVEAKRVNDAWDELAAQSYSDEAAMRQRARMKERETDVCNFKISELRQERLSSQTANDHLISAMAAEDQAKQDNKRCDYLNWSKKTNKDCRVAMIEQIKDRKKVKEERRRMSLEDDGYLKDIAEQYAALARHKDDTDAQERRRHGQNVLQHIEYNKLLKERALQEEREQVKKYQIAEDMYNKEIASMLGRPFFSDFQHAFMKQLSKGLKMQEKCPCTKPDYCAE